MKEYQKKAIDNINTKADRAEAIKLMGVPTTEMLDFMIKSLETGIAAGVRPYVTENTIETWRNVLAHLKAARSFYATN